LKLGRRRLLQSAYACSLASTTLTKVVSALNCPLELTERHQIRAFAEFPDVLQAGYAVRN